MDGTTKPFGGRYAEWTDGTYRVKCARPEGVPTAPLPKVPGAAHSTAPLPKISNQPQPLVSSPSDTAAAKGQTRPIVRLAQPLGQTQPMVAPPPSPIEKDSETPPPSSRGAGVPAGSATPRKAVAIEPDPIFDKLLSANSYERPYLLEQKAETDGDPAAAHSVGPRELAPGLDTPPLEPRLKLTDSVVRELEERAAAAAKPEPDSNGHEGATTPRDLPTVVTRSVPSRSEAESSAKRPIPRLALAAGGIFMVAAATLFGLLKNRPQPTPPVHATEAPRTSASSTAPRVAIPPPPSLPAAEESSRATVSSPEPEPPTHESSPPPPKRPASQGTTPLAPKGSAPGSRSTGVTAPRATPSAAPVLPFHPLELERHN